MEQPRNSSRGYSRAVPVPEARSLNFMGTDGSHSSPRPTVYAKMGEPSRKSLKQAPAAPAGHAPLSIADAGTLRDAIVAAQPAAEFLFKSKGCPGITQDSFTKLADLKSRLDNFLSTEKEGNTFPVSSDDLDLMDKILACSIKAQNMPDPWAYVVLGAAVVGTILAVSL